MIYYRVFLILYSHYYFAALLQAFARWIGQDRKSSRRDHVPVETNARSLSTSFLQSEYLAEIRCVANSPGDLVIRAPGMHKRVRFILVAFSLLSSAELQVTSRNSGYSPHAAKRTQGPLHLPMSRRLIPKRITLSADTGVAGLGDFFDV